MLIGEQRAVSELWEAARKRLPAAREDRPGQPVYAISTAPEPGDSGLRAADALRPRPARPRLRARPRGRARDRSAAAGRGRLPLADAGADRRGPLVALGGGRRHPLQGGGVRVDAAGGAAAAGLDRSRGARRRQRRPRAARPDPAAARAGADRLPLRPRRQRRRDRASTTPSGWSTSSTTGACSCETAPRRAPRRVRAERQGARQRRSRRRLPLDRARPRAGTGARHGPRRRADRPLRRDRVRARARDGRDRARRPRRPVPRRPGAERPPLRRVRGRLDRRVPRMGLGAGAARRARRRRAPRRDRGPVRPRPPHRLPTGPRTRFSSSLTRCRSRTFATRPPARPRGAEWTWSSTRRCSGSSAAELEQAVAVLEAWAAAPAF